MSHYDEIMQGIIEADIELLEKLSKIVDQFPTGKDDLVERYWITNAIDCGNLDVVQWMLSKQVPLRFEDDEGYSVLHSAIGREQGDKHRILELLIEAGADINMFGVNGWTPAHMAAVYNDVEALKILHHAGADFTLRTPIDYYATPLEEAILAGGSPKAVAYLKSLG